MADILIRDVESGVHDQLKARAAAAGQTLQAYLHDVLRSEVEDDAVGVWFANVQSRRRTSDRTIDVVAAIHAGREERDRAVDDAISE